MNEMVERVARALVVARNEHVSKETGDGIPASGWENLTDRAHQHYFLLARAAIEAMRVLTKGMIGAVGVVRLPSYDGSERQHAYDIVSEEDIQALHEAMIDEALRDAD